RLLTNKKGVRRGLGDNSACGICGHNIEDAIHTIRDCNVAKEWFVANLHNHLMISMGEVDWPCLFGSISWRIWKNHNLQVFQGVPWSVDEVMKGSFCWAKQFATARKLEESKRYLTFSSLALIVLEVELWAIFDDLTLILDRGHDRVLINTDSM
ncbi:hypothetical protein Goarm_010247, partial [Gossypium armourianum]|nr:hypothetical protein [Gossypium armourianum]